MHINTLSYVVASVLTEQTEMLPRYRDVRVLSIERVTTAKSMWLLRVGIKPKK